MSELLPCLAQHFTESFWFTADYLLWWNKDNHLPPLLTTGSIQDARPGALGQSGTKVLYGGAIDSEERSGGRFSAGLWLTDDHCIGLDASFFFLGSRSAPFSTSSTGDPILAQPIFDANTGQAIAYRLALPTGRAGSYTASVGDRFWGTEANARTALVQDDFLQWAVLAGFRYLDLSENLTTGADIVTSAQSQRDVTVETITSQRFGTRNYFYGGQLGSELTVFVGRLSMALSTKVALGGTHEIALIEGMSTYRALSGQVVPLPFSELVFPSNAGRYSRDIFTVVPELGVHFGYDVTSHIRVTAGYTFLYMSNAIRPGDLIDTTVNLTQAQAAIGGRAMTGPQRPTFAGNATDFWAQGVDVGLELRY
jgi:hypothetical protein